MKTTTTTNEATIKRLRATASEMSQRIERALEFLAVSELDTTQLAGLTGLTYSQTNSLIGRMVDLRLISYVGRKDGRKCYTIAPVVAEVAVPAQAEEPAEAIIDLPPVSASRIVSHLHLGSRLEIIGLRMEGQQACLDVLVDGEKMSLVPSS